MSLEIASLGQSHIIEQAQVVCESDRRIRDFLEFDRTGRNLIKKLPFCCMDSKQQV